jgi:DNA-binding MarR family transcriptional regulator
MTEDRHQERAYGDEIVQLVRRIVRLSHVQSRRMVQRYGLTGPQLMCLQALFRAGEMTPTALARSVELSPATVTGIVHRLEARGMVQRTRSQVDRRSSVLTLTAAAQETFATLPRSLESRFTERLRGLSESEQGRLTHALQTLVELMGDDFDLSPEALPREPLETDAPLPGAPELHPEIGAHVAEPTPWTGDATARAAGADDLTPRPDGADSGRTTR